MRQRTVIVLCSCLWAASLAAGPADTNGLPALRHSFDDALAKATAAYAGGTADLPGKYRQWLDEQEGERRRTGDLDAVVALRRERAHFAATTNVVIENARTEHGVVLALKRQYLYQLTLAADRRDDLIAAAAKDYTNQLETLKVQLTRKGRTAEALLVQSEQRTVAADPQVSRATLGAYAREAAAAASSNAATAGVAAPGTLDPERLLDESVVTFRINDSDLSSPADVLSRLHRRCMDRGIRLRVAASRLNVKSVKIENGVPRYVLSPVRSLASARPRGRGFSFNNVPLRVVMQTFCAAEGLSYRADRDQKELVLLDAADPQATWTPDPLPADQIAAALETPESRRQHIGKTVLAEAEVASAVQGVSDFILGLKDGTRMYLPTTTGNHAAYDRIRNALSADRAQGRQVVEVTALASVHPESTVRGLVLGNAVLLEVGVGGNYSLPVPMETPAPAAKPIRRLDDWVKTGP